MGDKKLKFNALSLLIIGFAVFWILGVSYGVITFKKRCIEDLKQRGLIFDNLNCVLVLDEGDLK